MRRQGIGWKYAIHTWIGLFQNVFTFWPIRKLNRLWARKARWRRHKNKAGADKCIFELHCSNTFAVNFKRNVYVIIHTFEKQPWQPNYDMHNMRECWNMFDLIWFEFIHPCDIGLSPTHGGHYAMCIERTKPSGGENRSPATQRLHVAETIKLKQ